MPEVQEPLTLAPEESSPQANMNGAASLMVPRRAQLLLAGHIASIQILRNMSSTPQAPRPHLACAKVMASLIQHNHDFARENEVTVDEWMAGVEFINETGRMSNDVNNEGQFVCDVIGLESLVDEITYKLVSEADFTPTATAILGPFWRADAPRCDMGATIVHNIPDGDHTFIQGLVKDYLTNEPIKGVELDVWHTAPNGLYEQQDENQVEHNLRGRFTTGKNGRYSFYCLRPTSYPIPDDGPAGKLLKLLDRHPMRPAHIHFIVSAPKYKPIVTQIFDRRDKHLANDSVFAVKDSLIVDFLPREGDPKAQFEVAYGFRLATFEEAKKYSLVGPTEEKASQSTVDGNGNGNEQALNMIGAKE